MVISIGKYQISKGLPSIRISNGPEDPDPIYADEIYLPGPSRIVSNFKEPIIKRFGVHVAIITENVEVIR